MNYTERTKLVDGICGAIVMLLLVEGFYGLSDSAYTVFNYKIGNVTNVIYTIGAILLAVSLFILIKAYREEKLGLGAYGIELLVLAISAGLLPGTYISYPAPFNKLNVLFPLFFGIYYIAKALYVLSRRNLSNGIMLGVIEAFLIVMYTFDLVHMNQLFFVIMAIITMIGLIYTIHKKSKFFLVHALEFMIATFMVLLIPTRSGTVAFGIIVAIYYILKSIFVTVNYGEYGNARTKRRKSK